jgi:hypothetical protein
MNNKTNITFMPTFMPTFRATPFYKSAALNFIIFMGIIIFVILCLRFRYQNC